jgi:GT2 family glycosyltransferase
MKARACSSTLEVAMSSSSVIIPVFNCANLTERSLETVLASEPLEVVVVDDASTDQTAEMLGSYGGRIKVVRHEQNLGFGPSCNDGALAAHGERLVFLNNDTIPRPGWLSALECYATQHPQAGAVGAKLLYPDNTIQHAGVVICQDGYPRHLYTGFPADHPAVNRSRRFQIVTGACMLIRREVFEDARGFDTAFRNGFEDVDLCLRLGRSGYEIHYCAESEVTHLESVSPGRFKRDGQNVNLYRERWMRRVRPDDIGYYLEDGLLQLTYEGAYPVLLEVSPLLATLEGGGRVSKLERCLRQRNQELRELRRENTRLALALGRPPGEASEPDYLRMRRCLKDAVQSHVPPGATLLVVSKGDGFLLDLPGRRGWHFPQTERGAYAGHHPASSSEAIAHLEALRARGADYLVIPAPSFWWLEHYSGLRHYLDGQCLLLGGARDTCLIYQLNLIAHLNPRIENASLCTVT